MKGESSRKELRMQSLKEWKERFAKARLDSSKIQRRAEKAEREIRSYESEMLAWAKAQTSARENILSGLY